MQDKAIWRRLRVRFFGYGPLLPGIGLPGGVRLLSTTNGGALLLASRHPRWSITWLWFVRIAVGADRIGGPWWRRFRFIMPNRLTRSCELHLGWVHLSAHWQQAMPYGPGYPQHDRHHHMRYLRRIAAMRADAIRADAYRAELVRLMEPQPDGEDAHV